MDISTLKQKELPDIPKEIKKSIGNRNITLTPFDHKNDILLNSSLQKEAGYGRFSDGSYLVSMYSPMPGITTEMITWWFWWHPQAKARYRVWFPGAHYNISYPRRCASYFEQKTQPSFQDNTQLPTEKIGRMKMPLRIDFLTPQEFGFSQTIMKKSRVPLIVCGHVGVFNGLIWHTEMAHIFHQTQDGLFLTSRFWLGTTMNPLLRKLMINDTIARGMTEHCAIEYRNLVEILPTLYKNYSKHQVYRGNYENHKSRKRRTLHLERSV